MKHHRESVGGIACGLFPIVCQSRYPKSRIKPRLLFVGYLMAASAAETDKEHMPNEYDGPFLFCFAASITSPL
jgi:hypothetical protein